jgi:hypothetical protein
VKREIAIHSLEMTSPAELRPSPARAAGGVLLTAAVERAWEMGASRVWVHTCSLDAPAALPSYEARGFRRFKTETVEKDLPAEPPGPWPGAR